MHEGIGIAVDEQGSDYYDYVVVIADLYCITDKNLSTLGGVLGKAHSLLLSKHEYMLWANPRGKNAKEALRVRFWMQSRAHTAAEIYEELLEAIQAFVTMKKTRKATLSEKICPGDVLDATITLGNESAEWDFLLNESDER